MSARVEPAQLKMGEEAVREPAIESRVVVMVKAPPTIAPFIIDWKSSSVPNE